MSGLVLVNKRGILNSDLSHMGEGLFFAISYFPEHERGDFLVLVFDFWSFFCFCILQEHKVQVKFNLVQVSGQIRMELR